MKKILSFILLISPLALLSCADDTRRDPVQTKVGSRGDSLPLSRHSSQSTLANDPDVYKYRHPYLKEADSLNEIDAYNSAIVAYLAAMDRLKREKHWKAYVWALIRISVLYTSVKGQDYRLAFPLLTDALHTGLTYLGPNHPFLALVYFYWGQYYFYDGNPKKSLDNYKEAFPIQVNCFGENSIYVADTYHAMAEAYTYLLYDEYSADEYARKALGIKEVILESNDGSFVKTYLVLTVANQSLGYYDKAVSYCFQAMRNVESVQHNQGDWREILNATLTDLIDLYLQRNDTARTIKELMKVIKSNQDSRDSLDLGYYWNELGEVYSLQHDHWKAIHAYRNVIKFVGNPSILNSSIPLNAHFGLGLVYQELKQNTISEWHLEVCLKGRLKLFGPRHAETAAVYEQLGKLSQQQHDPQRAMKYFRKALWCSANPEVTREDFIPAANQFTHPLRALSIAEELARITRQTQAVGGGNLQNLRTALAYYCLADTLLLRLQTTYGRENSRLMLSENNHALYEGALDCIWQLHAKTNEPRYLEWALRFMDQRKSSLLLEAVEEEAIYEKVEFLQFYQRQRKELRQKFSDLQSKLREEHEKTNPDSLLLKNLHARINTIEAEQNRMNTQLQEKHPAVSSLLHQADNPGLKQVQAFLTQGYQGIVEYFWGDSAVYVLGVGPKGTHLLKVGNTSALQQHLRTYRSILEKGYDWQDEERDFFAFQQSALVLYNTLFKPIEDRVAPEKSGDDGQRRILLVLDGPLFGVPFESLVRYPAPTERADYGQMGYLVKDHLFTYHYSLELAIKSTPRAPHALPARVLAFGFSQEDSVSGKKGLAELPGSVAELKAIASSWDGEFFWGEEATEQRFKAASPEYAILHFALHGQADEEHPLRSKLLFKAAGGTKEDGQLYTYELYSMEVRAALAVLSACETGGGKIYKREGVYSLARGFLYAGCPTVVTSLWKAGDMATVQIMKSFYGNLSTGSSVDKSLWRAKTDYLQQANSRSAHPSSWATFVMVGKANVLVGEPAGN